MSLRKATRYVDELEVYDYIISHKRETERQIGLRFGISASYV